MTTSSPRPRVFLSYARADAEIAERLRPLLRLAGFVVWRDSDSLASEHAEITIEAAIVVDFVVAILSTNTWNGPQAQEIRAAVRLSEATGGARRPVVFPCAITQTSGAAFYEIVPDFLRQLHVLDLTDFKSGWPRLYESLRAAATTAGIVVPRLLRAAPEPHLDRTAADRMIIEKGFFSKSANVDGGLQEPELELAVGDTIVNDKSSARAWTRSCVSVELLPTFQSQTADELAAQLIRVEARSEAQNALVEARRRMGEAMNAAVDEWIALVNVNRLGGYDDWRLPTLEEAMSLMSRHISARGLYISDLFSEHEGIRTADRSPGLQGPWVASGAREVWMVTYQDADCWPIPEDTRLPLRFVRTDLD